VYIALTLPKILINLLAGMNVRSIYFLPFILRVAPIVWAEGLAQKDDSGLICPSLTHSFHSTQNATVTLSISSI